MGIIKKILNYQKDDSLIRDGIILFTATMIGNFAAYLFHFGMGRFLGPAEYGVLGAILSLLYLLLVPFNVIQTTISKFVAKFKAQNEENKIKYLFYKALRRLLIVGIIGLIIFLILSPWISEFLKINKKNIMMLSIIVPFVLLLPINRGVLQGFQKFKALGVNLIIEALTKLAIGFLLVLMGFGLRGAVIGIILSYIIPFLSSLILLRKEYSKKEENIEEKTIYKYSIPVLITLLSLTAFYSIDVMLVKHYFDEISAGQYAAMAILGRIVFFASLAISMVMFPKVAEMDAQKKPNAHILKKALALVAIVSTGITTTYFLIPNIVVQLLFGKEYLIITNYIAPFALLMSFFSLTYLLALYNLSVNRTSFIYILLSFNIIEITSIVLFHNTLKQVLTFLGITMGLMFITILAYTLIKNARALNNNTSIQ